MSKKNMNEMVQRIVKRAAGQDWYQFNFQNSQKQKPFQNNLPQGTESPFYKDEINKSTRYYRNEIEAVLTNKSDLSSSDVGKVMAMLPNMEKVYDYLKSRQQGRAIQTLDNLLRYSKF